MHFYSGREIKSLLVKAQFYEALNIGKTRRWEKMGETLISF